VRSNALMMLVEAVFGRGAFVSERAVRIVALTTGEGVTPRSAVKRADAEAEASKGADWDRAALHAILDRMRLEASMSRRTAVQALGEVVTRARVRGDEECIAGLLRVLDDGDAHVQHAGIVALAAATLPGDARVIAALVRFAAHNEHWQCRKAAIEALEQLALPGCAVTVEALGALMRDKDSWVRDAHPLRLSKWLYKPFVSS
jgi:HEAT repeat protein